jgi:hypothetical protein
MFGRAVMSVPRNGTAGPLSVPAGGCCPAGRRGHSLSSGGWNRPRLICYNKGNVLPVQQTQPPIV